MYILGLTGGSGAGKSTVSDILSKHGCTVLDADAIYHGLIAHRSPCSDAIADAFGESVRNEDGGIDRARLRKIVFSDAGALAHLNEIAHRYVRLSSLFLMGKADAEGAHICVLDAPQLFEAGMERLCDGVACVICSRDVKIKRIMERDGISRSDAELRLSKQLDDDFFTARGDFVFRNEGDLSALEASVHSMLDSILSGGGTQ